MGTPWNTLTRWHWIVSSTARASNRGTIVRQAPAATEAFSPQVWPERVEQRERAEHDITGREREQAGRDLGVADQVGVGQLGTLGRAGGARRVEDDGGVLRVAPGDPVLRGGGGQQCLELARPHQHASGARGGRAGHGLGREAVPRQHHRGLRITQVERHLTRLQQHVHRHDHAASAQDAVVHGGELRHVGQHAAHPVARPDTPVAQQRRDPGAGLVELRKGQRRLAEADRRSVAGAGRRGDQVVSEVGHGKALLSHPIGSRRCGADVMPRFTARRARRRRCAARRGRDQSDGSRGGTPGSRRAR